MAEIDIAYVVSPDIPVANINKTLVKSSTASDRDVKFSSTKILAEL